ncbi:ABC transporter ATP-binding protein [Salinisphaera sp. LB1]|uniref:ABC transporter ATP-binding protein n=1 Tax=Salinisphaera sp. LB1 TaxID=2183911 RepID=UPI000D705743|nr:ABC transporter ATP-binding protein [Salinisphaera sp. LB1]AWN14543.1 Branched-chain amino acid transport ATP-binding protein LivF [Salinisphaera sp. LB1]
MSDILHADQLHTYYGKSHILHGVSLRVAAGEIVTLLGRNGAGKTTTLRSLMGLTPPRKGRIQLFGKDVTGWPPHRIAKLGVGYVPEGRKIFGHLTVHDNLRVPAATSGRWTLDTVYELFPRLAERRTSKGGQLSGGEQEMLAIARALLLNPRFLILDEPSQGLAPVIVEEVMKTVVAMRDEGIAVLLVEQNAWLALRDADRAYVLGDGAIVHEGSAAELAADEDRVKALAGASLDTSASAAIG